MNVMHHLSYLTRHLGSGNKIKTHHFTYTIKVKILLLSFRFVSNFHPAEYHGQVIIVHKMAC